MILHFFIIHNEPFCARPQIYPTNLLAQHVISFNPVFLVCFWHVADVETDVKCRKDDLVGLWRSCTCSIILHSSFRDQIQLTSQGPISWLRGCSNSRVLAFHHIISHLMALYTEWIYYRLRATIICSATRPHRSCYRFGGPPNLWSLFRFCCIKKRLDPRRGSRIFEMNSCRSANQRAGFKACTLLQKSLSVDQALIELVVKR
jgi:hypothetical protein